MYDFETEYRRIFETPLEEIKEDIFFRADNFENETWYGDLQMYLAIGVCKPEKDCVPDLQKALKVLGFPAQTREIDGDLFLVPPEGKAEADPAPPKTGNGTIGGVYDWK